MRRRLCSPLKRRHSHLLEDDSLLHTLDVIAAPPLGFDTHEAVRAKGTITLGHIARLALRPFLDVRMMQGSTGVPFRAARRTS